MKSTLSDPLYETLRISPEHFLSLSDTMYLLISFRESTPPQNRQHHISISSSRIRRLVVHIKAIGKDVFIRGRRGSPRRCMPCTAGGTGKIRALPLRTGPQVHPIPKSSASRLYGVDRGTHFKFPGTNRFIIWGRGQARQPRAPTRRTARACSCKCASSAAPRATESGCRSPRCPFLPLEPFSLGVFFSRGALEPFSPLEPFSSRRARPGPGPHMPPLRTTFELCSTLLKLISQVDDWLEG